MKMAPDCFACLYEQALRVTKALECDEACAFRLLKKGAGVIKELEPNQTPPEAAAILYPALAKEVGCEDLYEKQKRDSINLALKYLDFVFKKIDKSQNPLDAALRAAVAGNVIDFATQKSFDIAKEIENIFEVSFAIDEKPLFLERLAKARRLVVIGDNVGEHLFDKLFLELVAKFYPDMERFYFTRGRPIINDVTFKEAKAIGMDRVCTIIDSGVDTPGFIYEKANEEARRIYDSADLVLAKGMGNFECMESLQDERLFFLFKVKCSVVAKRVNQEVGTLICVNAKHI